MGEQKKKHSAIGSKVKHATGTFWYGTYLATMVIGFLFRSPKIIRYLSIGSNTDLIQSLIQHLDFCYFLYIRILVNPKSSL